MPARMVPASMAGQLAQLGVGDCLRFAVGDEHPDEGSRRWREIPGSWCSFPAELPLCCVISFRMGIKMHGAYASWFLNTYVTKFENRVFHR